jgi:hypothetical protein
MMTTERSRATSMLVIPEDKILILLFHTGKKRERQTEHQELEVLELLAPLICQVEVVKMVDQEVCKVDQEVCKVDQVVNKVEKVDQVVQRECCKLKKMMVQEVWIACAL